MNELAQHPKLILEVLAAYWLFSAIVTSMPVPPKDSFWYLWLYGALHAFAGDVSKFAASKIAALESSTTVTVTKHTEANPASQE